MTEKNKAIFSAVENDPLEKWINNMKINYWNKNILQNTLQKNWCLRSHQRELCSTCGISVFFTCWYYFLRCFREQCRLHLWQNALVVLSRCSIRTGINETYLMSPVYLLQDDRVRNDQITKRRLRIHSRDVMATGVMVNQGKIPWRWSFNYQGNHRGR